MKTYLNSEERNTNVLFYLVCDIIIYYLERKENFSQDEVKWLESTRVSLLEYLNALNQRIGEKEAYRLMREANNSKPVIKPRGDKCEGQYLIDKNTLEEICRLAVESHCFGCVREDYQNCPLCRFMDRAGMGSSDEQPNKCTYWYPKEG